MPTVDHCVSFLSPIGNVCVRANDHGITSVGFEDEPETSDGDAPSHLQACVGQLQEYFEGKRKTFDDLSLVFHATDFQRQVWDRAAEIPFGRTVSYGELAAHVGSREAARAVGTALNRNVLAIIIPCHRVVAEDGAMTGYASGIWRKEWLIGHEKKLC